MNDLEVQDDVIYNSENEGDVDYIGNNSSKRKSKPRTVTQEVPAKF